MKVRYVVVCVTNPGTETEDLEAFEAFAEDEDQARAQCEAAHSGCKIVEVHRSSTT